jgi:hypothetical protein
VTRQDICTESRISRIAAIIESHFDVISAYDIAVEIYETMRADKPYSDNHTAQRPPQLVA